MERHFEKGLEEVKERLVWMGSLAERAVHQAVQAVLDSNAEIAQRVLDEENAINEMQIEIDEQVMKMLALQQLTAGDLRFMLGVARINSDLERIGDQAVNICQNTTELLRYPPLKPLIDIPLMAEIARRMLRESLDAFVRQDAALAQKVLDTDDEVDAFKNQIFRELLTYMMADPGTIPRALALILISRNLERVGDHATNIAEEVIYSAQGRDVRHRHEQKKRSEEGK